MKFAHEFRAALKREGYPQRWVDSAIPYGQLKKLLKKVQRELNDFGLDPETMRELLTTQATSSADGSTTMTLAKYHLDPNESNLVRPRLTVFVQLKDGVAVDASLSPTSRALMQKLASHAPVTEDGVTIRSASPVSDRVDDDSTPVSPVSEDAESVTGDQDPQLQRIEVPLVFDGEFFQVLQTDVVSLDALQKEEQESMTIDIVQLGQEIAEVAKPSRYSKSDLSRWREIFELYLDAGVFFSSQELDHGARTSDAALKQLVWFQNEVHMRGLPSKFKLAASQEAYQQFLALNATLLQNLKFQEINKTAVKKILKKFDKRTSLGVSRNFPIAIQSESLMGETVAKNICAQVSTVVVSQVPRLDDYLCPICFSIAWLPVRLTCHHVFCIRCMVKMQRDKKHSCPLCRANVIMEADTKNLDEDLIRFLERWFRKETREKQKANETERGKELFGESYQHSSCCVM